MENIIHRWEKTVLIIFLKTTGQFLRNFIHGNMSAMLSRLHEGKDILLQEQDITQIQLQASINCDYWY